AVYGAGDMPGVVLALGPHVTRPGAHRALRLVEAGELEEPSTEQRGLGQRARGGVLPDDAQDGGGSDNIGSGTAALLVEAEPGDANRVERSPHAGGRRRIVDGVGRRGVGEHLVHHRRQVAQVGCGQCLGAHRTPIPRATTPRRISLVPPRIVKPGVCSTAWASRRRMGSSEVRSGSTSRSESARATTSPSKRVPKSLTRAAGTSWATPDDSEAATSRDMARSV